MPKENEIKESCFFETDFWDTCVTIVCRGVNWTELDPSAKTRAPKMTKISTMKVAITPCLTDENGHVNSVALVSALGPRHA